LGFIENVKFKPKIKSFVFPHLTASLATIYVELIIELHYVAVLGHRGALVRYTPADYLALVLLEQLAGLHRRRHEAAEAGAGDQARPYLGRTG